VDLAITEEVKDFEQAALWLVTGALLAAEEQVRLYAN
jgi:hypothetical protein